MCAVSKRINHNPFRSRKRITLHYREFIPCSLPHSSCYYTRTLIIYGVLFDAFLIAWMYCFRYVRVVCSKWLDDGKNPKEHLRRTQMPSIVGCTDGCPSSAHSHTVSSDLAHFGLCAWTLETSLVVCIDLLLFPFFRSERFI